MLAVHFGAGNIGRGFIGQLLSESGYEICFIDVNQNIIDDINSLKQYSIEIVDDSHKRILVKKISAQNCKEKCTVINKISQADIITTAVGPNILKVIAPIIAAGLAERIRTHKKAINIIACENIIMASSVLKQFVCNYLAPDECAVLKKYVGFPNSAVDRLVPIQKSTEKLLVQTESFFEWDIDETAIIGTRPLIKGAKYVKNLKAYIERKLFAVNATHAAIAYLGYTKNIKYINCALENDDIKNTVKLLLNEAGILLNKKYDFDLLEYGEYTQATLKRFSNKYISDDITRVCRDPIRKLSPNDRLAAPAIQLAEKGIIAKGYATVIAAALCFDYKNDKEATILQTDIKNNGVAETLFKYSKIEPQSDLGKCILEEYYRLKSI